MIELTPRLLLAAEKAKKAGKIIDVGCDHAYLSIFMAHSTHTKHIYAADLRKGPLENARRNIEKYNMQDKIETRLCDGLSGFNATDADSIVVCGMGGDVMCGILEGAPWCMSGQHRLILQPMTQVERLRAFLKRNACGVLFEGLAEEGEKLYTVIEARGRTSVDGIYDHLVFTDKMMEDPLFGLYIQRQIEKYEKIADGKQRAKIDNFYELRLLNILKTEAQNAT